MKVLLARHAGACYGVKRALDMAYDVLGEGGCAVTLGPLIHNPQVVSDLQDRGIGIAKDLAEASDAGVEVIIVRSHGVTPDVRRQLEESGAEIVDATCPHVQRAQRAAADLGKSGCHVLVVGEAGHPEVEALVAYARQAGANADVVLSPDDIPDEIGEPVGVVVQTTQTKDNLQAVLDELSSRGLDVELRSTICSATQERQEAAAEVAAQADAMVVIGGKNSSNTTRLAEICAAICANTFHIESVGELEAIDFSEFETVGVTAGASTPESQIDEVVAAIS